jgi:APA family basic amino acid/polyamine antiporter
MRSKPKLNLFDLTMLVIGLVIGMGIFRTSRDAAQAALTPTILFSAWIIGGEVALCGALTYAEIGSRYPSGRLLSDLSCAYHPSVFCPQLYHSYFKAASLSGVALIGAEYIAPIIFKGGSSDLVKAFIAMGAIVLFYGVNLMGLRMSSKTQNVLMLIKISMLVVLIAALFFPQLYHPHPTPVMEPQTASFGLILLSFGVALKATSFTYGGYQQTINFGEEVENPRKILPRGIFIGIIVIITLYLLVSYSYYKIIGFEELKADNPNSSGIAAIIAEKMFGPMGRYVSSSFCL